MTRNKVFIDSNVVVAASIRANVKSIGITVQHQFYDQSIHLFGVFRKNASKQIGITTKTVRGESFNILSKAVNGIIFDNHPDSFSKRRQLLNSATAIVNLCYSKMQGLFSTVIMESPDDHEVQTCMQDVNNMSDHVKLRYNTRYSTSVQKTIEAKRRTEKIMGSAWKFGLKKEVYRAHRLQVERESVQPERFMRKYPNRGDSRILAEAIVIKRGYESDGDMVNFYIASCDVGFFSPLRLKGNAVSDLVTAEIHNRFGIICDFPKEIIKKLSM